MATKGLSFENPLYQDANGVPSAVINPFGFQNAAASSGSDALRDDLSSLAMMGGMGVQLARQNQFTMPEMKQPPAQAYYSPSGKQFFVQGVTFASDDAQQLLESQKLFGGRAINPPTGGDWVPLDSQSYGQLVQNVRSPSLGTLAARNFGRGVDQMQMLAGRGLQLAGAEETGGRIVAQQEADLAKTAPYERQFTDIESGRGAVEWLAANFAQQGPNMIESIATAGLGFLAGTAASGNPIGGAAAAFSSLLGKSAWKESVKAALSKQAKGELLKEAEEKLLREAAGIGGAVAASYAQNLATGAADIYGEKREQGAGAEDTNARLTALAGSVPYALFETLPEFLLTARVLRGVGAPAPMGVGISPTRRGLELLRRGAVGGAIGGAAEGTTELAQEAQLLFQTDQDFGSPENVNRLINSFAAGFGIGGPAGALANLKRTPIIKDPTNLLNQAQNPNPAPGSGLVPVEGTGFTGFPRGGYTPAPPGTGMVPYSTPVSPMGAAPGAGAPLQLGGPAAPATLQLPAPTQPLTPMGGPVIMAGMGPNAANVTRQDILLRQQGNVPPGATPGSQGVLDIFGGTIPAQELAARMQPQAPLPGLPAPSPAVAPDQRQGALQFAGPAPMPVANTQMANQLQVIQDRRRRQQEFEAAQAQQAALIQQQTEALAQQSANARDLYTMQQGQTPTPFPSLPMRQAGPTQPQQLPLFGGGLPRPTRGERLRAAQPLPTTTALPEGTLLTQPAQPEVAGETRADLEQERDQLQRIVAAYQSKGTNRITAPIRDNAIKRLREIETTLARMPATTRGLRQATLQVPMLGATGEPTLPALRAAGVKTKVAPTPPKPRATKTAGARGLRKGAKVAEIITTQTEIINNYEVTVGGKPARVTIVRPTDDPTGLGRVSLRVDGNPLSETVLRGERLPPGMKKRDVESDEQILQYLRSTDVINAKGEPDATKTGKLKQGRVAKRQQDNAGVQGGGDVGDKPATEVKAGGAQAGGSGIALKRGKKATEVKKEAPKPPKAVAAIAAAPASDADLDAGLRRNADDSNVAALLLADALVSTGHLASEMRDIALVYLTKGVTAGRKYLTDLVNNPDSGFGLLEMDDAERAAYIQETNNFLSQKTAIFNAAAPAVTETPAETWDAMDTGVEWTALSSEQQTQWTDSDRVQTTADTIAEDVRNPQTPEALWEDMKPEGAPEYNDLPAPVRAQWRKDADAGKATIQRAEEILGDVEETPLQLVNSEFAAAEGATDIRDFRTAISPVIEFAYFTDEGTNTKAAVMRARELLANTLFTADQLNAIDAALIELVNALKEVEAVYTRGAPKGDSKPWFDHAVHRGLLPQITTVIKGLSVDAATKMLDSGQLRIANLPADTVKKYKASVGPISGTIGKAGANLKNDTRSNAATALSDEIKQINTYSGQPYNATKRAKETKKLRDLWAAVQAAGMEDFADQNGVPLSDYFDADGNPNVGRIDGQFRVATEEITDAVQAEREKVIAEDNIPTSDDYEAPFSMDDWNIGRDDDYGDGRYFRDDGTPINNPIPLGRVKMLVSAFLSKLGIKPKVQVYRNQADFKAKNPKLYAQAAASRPQGDFDTASAVGFSFGDGNVIIFADRVATEQQLKFVLAHETLGHFGFRGLLTEKELNAALDGVYNSSAKVKAAVDTAMQARKMSRQEATEEYLADFAGMLDTNIIARFWNAIKNALNKLGVTFEDDMARYLVSQSRRYVRNGTTSGTFMDFKTMAQRMAAIEGIDDPDGSGRFALAGEYYDEINRVAAMDAFGRRSFNMSDASAWFQRAKDAKIDLSDLWVRVRSELRTMNYAARENQGYRELYNIYRDTSKGAAQLRAQYNKMMDTVLSPAAELPGLGKVSEGATEKQIDQTSAMLRAANSARRSTWTDTETRKFGSLIKIVGGIPTIDEAVFQRLAVRGRMTLDEFKAGFTYTMYRTVAMTDAYRDDLGNQRDAELALAESDKERAAITKDYKSRMEEPSMTVAVERSFPAMPDLTEQNLEWVMYNEVRDTMDKSARDLLMANFSAARQVRNEVQRKTRQFLDRILTDNDKAFLEKISDKYLELYRTNVTTNDKNEITFDKKSIAKADELAEAVNRALLGKDTDRNAAVQAFFNQSEADDVFAGIEALKKDSKPQREDKKLKFAVQQAIQNLATAELMSDGAEKFAAQSIGTGYVPFGREGSWQIRVQAVDPETGRIYKVAEQYRAQMFFAQVDSKSEALRVAERVQGAFDQVEGGFEIEVLDGTEYVIKKVKLVAQPETARETVSTTAEVNLNEIIATLTRFSVSITPQERENLVKGLTAQNSRARSRLQRAETPGEDPNTIKYVSQHLEANASTVARKQNRYRLDRLFDESDPESRTMWRGSTVEYNRRKNNWAQAQKDPAMPEVQKLAAKREFDDYHFTFVTNKAEEQGNKYIDRGRRLVEFMESQSNVDYTDFASGDLASKLRTWTTFAFMGASFATAVLNYLSLATNVLPAFSGYNQKNAFGGGFGWGMSSVEISRAIGATKGFGQSEIKFWDDLLTDPAKLAASGFTEVEARFMQKEVGGGTMQAALTNSLLGSARGNLAAGWKKKSAEAWMSLFNYTEQHSRRATGLAAFRMAYARALAEGKDAATAFEVADKVAVEMIDNTLGEYAMYNRPAMFRGDVRQFIFMFKMFPVNSIQMLAALPRKEQLLALGILAMFAGLKGLPFAEDLMDIIDTIAQALGLGPNKVWKGSAEKTLAEALDAIAPGMTPLLMRGVINTFTPANVADRVSLSNIIPGTGIALAGADVGRELIEIAGPLASFLQGAAAMSADVARYGLETVGVLDDKTSLNKLARESPVAMLRALGDMVAYNNAGAIISQKGFVVSNDLHLGTMLTRALGFYPASAVAENDVVRLSKRVGDYQKDIAATYRGLYVSAKIAKDTDRANEVIEMVKDWNNAAKGTGLEIRNFDQSANRALREAQRTATERFLRTQPKAMRPETERMLQLYGVTE